MKYKTPKEKTIARLVDNCKSASRRDKKIRKGINQCDVTFESMLSLMEKQNWKCAEMGTPGQQMLPERVFRDLRS